MEFTLEQIARLVDGIVIGNPQEKVYTIAKIQEGHRGAICFLANPKYEPYLYQTKATAVIVNKDFQPQRPVSTNLIAVEDAYTALSKILEEYQKIIFRPKLGVEEPSFIHHSAQVGENCYIGAFAYIGENVQIGKGVKIYPHVYIGDSCIIGDNTVIYAGVKIYQGCKIGKNCVLHSGVVIGSDGFGFAPQPDGSYKPVPQIGGVIIEDDVSIGANTTVDRATLGNTILKKGVKLDNLIMIAHNVEVGEHTVIASQTGVSGSTKIGAYCVIGGQVGFAGHITVADKTSIAGKSGVMGDINESGQQLMGVPVMPLKEHLRALAVFKRLSEVWKRLERLEKKLFSSGID
ncbi:MAG: UDP-3-O-(3-hydroxymyristoyl)glucosamine N-acyltransferase [Cytophagales bacterium]|nr:UDP-3-O-(3-hydroxymyristoyl)glucosamine N-acyltransferase [Cytophagales bacterium]MDW8384551.1 UDP-3-O-(3-hydroxymyristoyl)glucosamine N-acyltransferase [Flammeovirgaceae bacterium]